MDILTGLGAAKTGFVEDLLGVVKKDKPDTEEIRIRLIQIQELLLKAQRALADAKEEQAVLREQLAASDRTKELRSDMDYEQDGGCYVRKSEKAAGKRIAYCRLCWTKDDKAVALNLLYNEGLLRSDHDGSTYQTAAYRRQEEQQGSHFYRGGPDSWMEN